MLSPKALTVLVFLIAGLLCVVVVTGLYQKSLDPTGIGVALISVIGGLVMGAFRRSGSDKDGDGP